MIPSPNSAGCAMLFLSLSLSLPLLTLCVLIATLCPPPPNPLPRPMSFKKRPRFDYMSYDTGEGIGIGRAVCIASLGKSTLVLVERMPRALPEELSNADSRLNTDCWRELFASFPPLQVSHVEPSYDFVEVDAVKRQEQVMLVGGFAVLNPFCYQPLYSSTQGQIGRRRGVKHTFDIFRCAVCSFGGQQSNKTPAGGR